MIEPHGFGAAVVDAYGKMYVRFSPNPSQEWAWISENSVIVHWTNIVGPEPLLDGLEPRRVPEPIRTHACVKDSAGEVYTKMNDGYWHSGDNIKGWENLRHPVAILFEGA